MRRAGEISRLGMRFLLYIIVLALAGGCQSPIPTHGLGPSCERGVLNGSYSAVVSGGDRVEGSFCNGQRCGMFTFYSQEVKIAELPYLGDVLHGMVRLWYLPKNAPNSPHRRKLAVSFFKGSRHEEAQSWFPNGERRALFLFENGVLVEGSAWSWDGTSLSRAEAFKLAGDDVRADGRYFSALESVVGSSCWMTVR